MNLKSTLLIILSTLSITAFAQKPKLAVYVTGDEAINNIVGNRLVDGLAHNGKYTTVERTASFLKALSAEHGYQRGGEVEDSQIAELGKQFGVQYVCVATIATVWGDEKYFSAHIIDVQTAEVVATGSSNGRLTSSGDLIGVLNNLSESLLNALDYSKKADAKKVAVYVTKTGNRDVDIILGDQLVAGFAKSGKYLAIERTSRFLSELSKEHGYQQSGAVDDDDIVRVGKQLGAQYVCVARTDNAYGDYFLTSRLIDLKGNVINSHTTEGKKLNSSQDVMALATEMAKILSGRTIEEEAAHQKNLREEEQRKREQDVQKEKKRKEREEELKRQGLVDLGLPSGTLWRVSDEKGFYTYDEARNIFGTRLPTNAQWNELISYCKWVDNPKGYYYTITGPNGNNIILYYYSAAFLVASFFTQYFSGYWSAFDYDLKKAWYLSLESDAIKVDIDKRKHQRLVHLVQ